MSGKFLTIAGRPFFPRGATYGAFQPDAEGREFTDRARVRDDLAMMADAGFTSVRIPHTVPPVHLLDSADEHGLNVMVGLSAEQYVGLVADGRNTKKIRREVADRAGTVAAHPALLCYALGNEIAPGMARWLGPKRVAAYLRDLYLTVKDEDPDGLVTYVNYPTTEYLSLPFLDFVSFNVYLEDRERFRAYLRRLHNVAGDRPLIMSELGLDALRNGLDAQADAVSWQVRTSFREGCAGAFVFSWTDEWYRHDPVDDWAFGLTDAERRPKPALAAMSAACNDVPVPRRADPRISVVICCYNSATTIRQCLAGVADLRYSNHEVIVIDDGSTDGTGDIARAMGVRVIATENRGLSHARNLGMREATGDIVAYLDSDAWPDPYWLDYLAVSFDDDVCAVGGPNLPPPGEGLVADCVAIAPGGPMHVLLTDDVAEHIPGCNMAFRRAELLDIGGFDEQFRVAGDDVDVCWRLQDRDKVIGFNATAVVWHQRRQSVRGYWKQQTGYGRAEALLEAKWPDRYNHGGHVSWRGRIYDQESMRRVSRTGVIYHGRWNTAPFQSLYQRTSTSTVGQLAVLPETWLLVLALLGIGALGFLWAPLFGAWAVAAAAIVALSVGAWAAVRRARFPTPKLSRSDERKRRFVAWSLYMLQPVARLTGRIRFGIGPWRRVSLRRSLPRRREMTAWYEHGAPDGAWLADIERRAAAGGLSAAHGGDFDRYDLEGRVKGIGVARLLLLAEEQGGGAQYVRIRVWPRCSRLVLGVSALTLALALAAFAAGSLIAGGVLSALAVTTGAVPLYLSGAAEGMLHAAATRAMAERAAA